MSVAWEPLEGVACVATAVGTENCTVTPGTGFWKASFTVAVTQCCAPTTFVAAGGVRVSVAGSPGVQIFVAAAVGSPAFCMLLLFVSA